MNRHKIGEMYVPKLYLRIFLVWIAPKIDELSNLIYPNCTYERIFECELP